MSEQAPSEAAAQLIRQKEALEFWLKKAAEVYPVGLKGYSLPASDRKSHCTLEFPSDLTASLQRISQGKDTNLLLLFNAAFISLIYRYTGQSQLLTSTPNLQIRDTNATTLLLLAATVEHHTTVQDLLGQLQTELKSGIQYADYDPSVLISRYTEQTGDSLLKTGLSYSAISVESALNSALATHFRIDRSENGFQLTHHFSEGDYDAFFAEQLNRHFLVLLEGLLMDQQVLIAELALLTPGEREQLTSAFNSNQQEFGPENVLHQFRRQVALHPTHTAVEFKGNKLSYRELDEKSNFLAAAIQQLGIAAGKVVAVMMDRSDATIISVLGIMKAGCAYLPIDTDNPADRIRYILEDSQAALVVTTTAFRQTHPGLISGTSPAWLELETVAPVETGPFEVSAEQTAYVIYTSGSTGNPKGVVIQHKALSNYTNAFNHCFGNGLQPSDRTLSITNAAFDVSICEFFATLTRGATLVIGSKEVVYDLHRVAESLIAEEITFAYIHPVWLWDLHDLLEPQKHALKLNKLLIGVEPIRDETVHRLQQLNPDLRIISGYGPTEITVACTMYACPRREPKGLNIPIGKPIANMSVFILGADDQLQPIGAAGEICVSGADLAKGYLNNPELTAEKFTKNPYLPGQLMYRTGDLGKWLPDGNIEFIGRRDAQVKIRGHRVEPGEIESRLKLHEQVRDAVVLAKKDNEGVAFLCAYVVCETALDSDALRTHLAQRLPEYMIPTVFMPVDRIPVTRNGKTDRRQLPEPDFAGTLTTAFVAPETPTQKKLADIWKKLLDRGQIGIDDRFFELGGHSLKAAKMISAIHRDLAVEVPLRKLFQTPTIRELADFIDQAEVHTEQQILPAPAADRYPVSFAQQRLYINYLLDPQTLAYNMPAAFILEGTPDKERFAAAFEQLVARHQSLRATFHYEENTVYQRIRAKSPLEVCFDKANGQPVNELIKAFVQPFDLSKDALIRVSLVELDKQEHLLLYDMHHIVSDGASMALIIAEFSMLYAGLSPEQLPIQFTDYAVWQQQFLRSPEFTRQEQFWLAQFSEPLEVLQLPTDFKRPLEQDFAGASFHRVLSAETTSVIRQAAVRQGVTPFLLSLTAFQLLLAKYSGQENIIVGTPMAGRQHAGTESLIGMFVNTLPVRSFPLAEKTIKQLIAETSERFFGAFENQDYPFEQLLEKLELERNPARNPLFDTFFVYQNLEAGAKQSGALTISPVDFEVDAAKFDITLELAEQPENILLTLNYATSLFTRATMEHLVDHYLLLLEQVCTSPQLTIGELDWITPEERETVLLKFNKPVIPSSPVLIHELFSDMAARQPEKTAVFFDDVRLTYKELDELSNAAAAKLQHQFGIAKGDFVCVMIERSEWLPVLIFGLFKIGAVYVPIDPSYPQSRVDYMLEDCQCKLLVSNVIQNDSVPMWQLNADEQPAPLTAFAPKDEITCKDLIYVTYTSGSTGQPKGVVVEHRNLFDMYRNMEENMGITAADHMLVLASVTFDISIIEIVCCLIHGMSITIANREDVYSPQLTDKLVKQNGINVLQFTPTRLTFFLDQLGPEFLHRVKAVIIGGEVIQEPLQNALLASPGTRAFNLYGPTECCVYSSFDEVGPGAITIGKPLMNEQILVLDKNRNLLPPGIVGEICITGTGVTRGYLNKEQLTADRFVSIPEFSDYTIYRTGDLGRWLPEGRLEFLGRMDHQVKIRGYRIELGEVETVLSAHPAITGTVAQVKTIHGEPDIVAYYESPQVLPDAELKVFLERSLPVYMCPAVFVHLEQFPVTTTGKVDRVGLQQLEIETSAVQRLIALPETALQQQLLTLWKQVLNRDEIGIADNFFELGGQSLKAMQLAALIQQEFDATLSIRDIFRQPTIKGLGSLLETVKTERFRSIGIAGNRPYYPLSAPQERLYVLNRMDENSTGYNMPGVLQIHGNFNADRLEQALQALIARHDVFRTSFELVDGRPVQLIQPHVHFAIERLDVPKNEVHRLVKDFIRPFDLRTAPLLRAAVIETGQQDYTLMYDVHHLISDGFSVQLFVKELTDLYRGLELEPLRLQYKDYAVWQQEFFTSGALDNQLEYWKKTLEGELPVLSLPTDFTRPAVQTFSGRTHTVSLTGSDFKEVVEFTRKHEITPNMLFLAVYNILLARYSGQDDIIVGTPIAGRPHADLQHLIGMFVNTLALRNYPSAEKTVAQFLGEVKERALAAWDNPDFPFEQLVEELKVPRDLSRNPVFDAMYLYADQQESSVLSGDLQFEPYEFSEQAAKFDLTFEAVHTPDRFVLLFNYNTALFRTETVAKMAVHLQRILEQCLSDVHLTLSAIQLNSQQENEQALKQLSAGAAPVAEDTLISLWETCVHQYPEQIAVSFGDRKLTYAEANTFVNRIAAAICEKVDIVPEDRIAVHLRRNELLPLTLLAVLKTGAAYVPLDPDYPQERLNYLIGDSDAKLIITDSAPDTDKLILPLNENLITHLTNLTIKYNRLNKNNLAYICYTSGSTGLPKGVMVEHAQIVAYCANFRGRFKIIPGQKWLALTNITFDIAVSELICALVSGIEVVIAGEETINRPGRIAQLISDEQIDIIQLTPSRFALLHEADKSWMNQVSTILIGGEAMPEPVWKAVQHLQHTRVFNVYGPTETCIWSSAAEIVGRPLNIGFPLNNEQLLILDEQNRLQPDGLYGEIAISGSGVSRGYWKRPELTENQFIQISGIPQSAVYKTGDIGRKLPDGSFECLGRKDQQVKLRGYRIELGEIEAAALLLDGIKLAAAFVRPDTSNTLLCLYFEGQMTEGQLREFLASQLPAYMIPEHIVQLPALPLTYSGKIDRNTLKNLPLQRIHRETELPQTTMQLQLAAVFSEILGQNAVGLHDSFFELGGNSMKLIRTLGKIEQNWGIELPLPAVFREPTISGIERLITLAGTSREAAYLTFNPGKEQVLFLFPPAIGYGFIYQDISNLLPETTIYAFHFIADDDRVDQYAGQIQAIHPEGSILVGGYSIGGNLAFEVAKKLEANGRELDGLLLVDSYNRLNAQPKDVQTISATVESYLAGLDAPEYQSLGTAFVQRLKQTAAPVIEAYQLYMNNETETGIIRADIYQLVCDEVFDSESQIRNWSTRTAGSFHVLQGRGAHPDMLLGDNLHFHIGLLQTIFQTMASARKQLTS